MEDSMKRAGAAFGLVAAIAVIVAGAPAQAKYPGTNGQVAFTRYDPSTGDAHVFVANPDGTKERQLPPGAADNAVWSPDGSKLLLTICCVTGPPRPAIINADGTGFTLLDVRDLPQDGAVVCRAWSPDGADLLCQFMGNIDPSLDGIYTIRASDGAVLKRLTINPFPPVGNFGGGDIPGDYSPDGTQFVFMRAKPGSGPVPDRNQSGALFVENSDGTGLHQITPYGLANSHDNGTARWSPDGREILFAAAHARFNGAMLFVIHADGTGLRKIPLNVGGTLSSAFTPGWSPDGTRIIFSMFLLKTGQEGIYTANPDGTGVTPVDTAGNEDNADWGTHPLAP
jgi:Tol biopolymer transport system component